MVGPCLTESMRWHLFIISISEGGPTGYLTAAQALIFDPEMAILEAGNFGDSGLLTLEWLPVLPAFTR